MEKAEAIAVLRELFVVCPEIGTAVFVSLDHHKTDLSENRLYKIRLGMNFDNRTKDCISKVLDDHKLKMIETNNSATIFRSAV